ncbi:MAG: cbb3-type cytochrome oxidase assembly protein CcoS [Bacteroidota bacterium]|nr:MAG: cbb3-type cytochrome oxidase assembly protein CcoS [Bacteroidota bacterium]
MSATILLIAFSLTVALTFLIAFIVSTRRGQYDDMHTPSIRMLFDDETPNNPS